MLDELARGWQRIAGFAALFPFLSHLGTGSMPTWCRTSRWPACVRSRRSVRVTRPLHAPEYGRRTSTSTLDWRGSGGFVGVFAALEQVITHLRQRRTGEADADEPTGLMTHHGFQRVAGASSRTFSAIPTRIRLCGGSTQRTRSCRERPTYCACAISPSTFPLRRACYAPSTA